MAYTAGGSTFLSLRTSTALSQLQLAVKNHDAPEGDLSQAQQALFWNLSASHYDPITLACCLPAESAHRDAKAHWLHPLEQYHRPPRSSLECLAGHEGACREPMHSTETSPWNTWPLVCHGRGCPTDSCGDIWASSFSSFLACRTWFLFSWLTSLENNCWP